MKNHPPSLKENKLFGRDRNSRGQNLNPRDGKPKEVKGHMMDIFGNRPSHRGRDKAKKNLQIYNQNMNFAKDQSPSYSSNVLKSQEFKF